MNSHGSRGKRRQLQRALQSIQIAEPPQRAKVQTEACEPTAEARGVVLQRPTGKDDKGMRALRRYHRYRQGDQQEEMLSQYKSLELARRQLRRRSQHRLNHSIQRPNAALDRSPYLPLHLRKLPPAASGEVLAKVASRESRKLSLPKRPLPVETAEQLKQAARAAMRRGEYRWALASLQRAEGGTSDLEALDMSGVCLMNLREFEEAVVRFSRLLLLDAGYSKKAYISVALCENQLNHAERCLHYINQCISRFPDFYEGFYFKGKLLYKQQLYQQAIDLLLQAAALNPAKPEIKLLVAECYFLLSQHDQALVYYERYLGEPTAKNARHAVRFGTLLIACAREPEGVAILEQVLLMLEGVEGVEKERVEANSQLSLAYFRRGNFELCAMRGEEVISRGSPELALRAIKSMVACKIIEHDYYGGIYFLRRLGQAHQTAVELQPYVQFLEGVALLMKRRVEQALAKLEQLDRLLEGGLDDFNVHIHRNFRLFVLYGLFLQGKYPQCLREATVQREVGVQSYWEDALAYVECICRAMLCYNEQKLTEAERVLRECIEMHPLRAEASLYLALLQMQLGAGEGAEGAGRRTGIMESLTVCADRFGSSSSNYSAFIFYFRGVVAAWEGEWAVAAGELELAIDKSEDNFFNFYYLRGLVLANLQNYKQAISDASLALSISEEPQAYLLRARCLQIDGNPGQAFADLQAFIALRPEDKQVHKFAGHLLFENGAFEDALQAYGQGEVGENDLEVFLTRSKTYFLLGNFLRAAEDMQQAARLLGDAHELLFDQRVMQWLAILLQRYIKNQCEDIYVFDPPALADSLRQLNTLFKEGSETTPKYGKIFKLPQYLTLAAACHFYLGDYNAAIDSLIEAIELKQATLERGQGEGEQGQFEEEQAQKVVFINQMYYNLAICCCMAHDYLSAERYLRKCAISPDLHNYDIYLELLDQITGRQAVEEDVQYLDLFSLRNKLSRYFPKAPVPFLCSTSEVAVCRPLKLCIPYPKVEPPEITPAFDRQLLLQIDLNQVERRADAPWIYREKDSIKFTERIDVFSRFELEKSEVGEKRAQIGTHPSGSSLEGLPQSLREQLKLDARLEERLNKLIRKDK